MRYKYFEKDGATFRGRAGNGWVDEVWANGKWQPYEGDGLAPVHFGSRVTAQEIGEPEEEPDPQHAAE